MKVKIGNIERNEEVKINISFIHEVSLVLNTFYEFRLPTTITPRYISRRDYKYVHESFGANAASYRGICYWNINIKIRSSRKLKTIFSKTHAIDN